MFNCLSIPFIILRVWCCQPSFSGKRWVFKLWDFNVRWGGSVYIYCIWLQWEQQSIKISGKNHSARTYDSIVGVCYWHVKICSVRNHIIYSKIMWNPLDTPSLSNFRLTQFSNNNNNNNFLKYIPNIFLREWKHIEVEEYCWARALTQSLANRLKQ